MQCGIFTQPAPTLAACIFWRCSTHLHLSPYGLRGGNAPRFVCWLWCYINCVCLCVYFTSFLTCFLSPSLCFFHYLFTSLLVYFLTYLSTPARIDPFHFQVWGHRRWQNLAVVRWGSLYEWMNEWKCEDFKCVWKPTESRLCLTHYVNKSSRWAK